MGKQRCRNNPPAVRTGDGHLCFSPHIAAVSSGWKAGSVGWQTPHQAWDKQLSVTIPPLSWEFTLRLLLLRFKSPQEGDLGCLL